MPTGLLASSAPVFDNDLLQEVQDLGCSEGLQHCQDLLGWAVAFSDKISEPMPK